MQNVLDHTQDLNGAETHRLTSLYPPPEFVKSASHDRLHGNPEQMQPHMYADQRNRLYPCHTGPATWMSTLFFAEKRANYKPTEAALIEARLNKAAEYFSISPLCSQLKAKVAADATCNLTKLADSDFALVWASEGGKDRHYPLRNANEVKTAARWFDKYRDEFVFDDRSRIAQKILEKAAEYGAAISEFSEMLNKVAGFGHCSAHDIYEMLLKRANLVARSHPEHSAELRTFAGLVQTNQENARQMTQKIASVVDQFDRQTKLNRMYDEGGLERPEEVLFQVTEKAARDFVDNHFQLTSGTVYEKHAFSEVALDDVRKWMGSDFADEVAAGGLLIDTQKLADIAATLPRGDAEMFDRMAQHAGIAVFARDKAAHATGMTHEDMVELASQYGGPAPLL